MRYCQECGNKCGLDMKFCPSCGAKLSEIDKELDIRQPRTQEINQLQEISDSQSEQVKENDFQQVSSDTVENSYQSVGVEIDIPVQDNSNKNNNWSYTNGNQTQNMSSQGWNYSGNKNNNQPNTNNKKIGFPIASLIIGVLSFLIGIPILSAFLFVGLSSMFIITLLIGIIGVVLAVLGLKHSKGLSIAGIIVNGIVVLLSLVFMILGGIMIYQAYENTDIDKNYYNDRFDDYYNNQFDDMFDDMF